MAYDGIPYLIQRVTRRKFISEHQKGFDRIFSLDYMGSAEFEFNTIPKALKAMRAAKNKKWEIRSITVGKNTAYYVGDPKTFNIAVQLFDDELKDYQNRKFRHKESTRIRETYLPEKGSFAEPYDAWWSLDSELPFMLFRYKNHAEDFLGVL